MTPQEERNTKHFIQDLQTRVTALEAKSSKSLNVCRYVYTHDANAGRPAYNTDCGWSGVQPAGDFCPHCGGCIIIQAEEN